MKVDLSDVPESTQLAVARLVKLSEDGHSGEVVVQMSEGGVGEVRVQRTMRTDELRKLAARESSNGRG